MLSNEVKKKLIAADVFPTSETFGLNDGKPTPILCINNESEDPADWEIELLREHVLHIRKFFGGDQMVYQARERGHNTMTVKKTNGLWHYNRLTWTMQLWSNNPRSLDEMLDAS